MPFVTCNYQSVGIWSLAATSFALVWSCAIEGLILTAAAAPISATADALMDSGSISAPGRQPRKVQLQTSAEGILSRTFLHNQWIESCDFRCSFVVGLVARSLIEGLDDKVYEAVARVGSA
jgi:hypothetical protein